MTFFNVNVPGLPVNLSARPQQANILQLQDELVIARKAPKSARVSKSYGNLFFLDPAIYVIGPETERLLKVVNIVIDRQFNSYGINKAAVKKEVENAIISNYDVSKGLGSLSRAELERRISSLSSMIALRNSYKKMSPNERSGFDTLMKNKRMFRKR